MADAGTLISPRPSAPPLSGPPIPTIQDVTSPPTPASTAKPPSYPSTPGSARGPPSSADHISSTSSSSSGSSSNRISSRYFRPSLVDLCIPIIAANFSYFPTFGDIPVNCREQIVALLSLDLPLEMAAELIYEDDYWKRKAYLQWKNCDVSAHGRSWKQLYFERSLSEALERYDPTTMEEASLVRLLEIGSRFIHNLQIYQLPSHLRQSFIFSYLARELSGLKLEFGYRNSGMKYDPANFGMKLSDCRSLAAALSYASTLSELNLSYNFLTDRKVKVIVEGMLRNPTVVHLDLSHNSISNEGVAEIAKLAEGENSVLVSLNLCNNQISEIGAIRIAEFFKVSKVLLAINLRHNMIGDGGGQAIFDGLTGNLSLQRLSLSGCGLAELSAMALGKLLHNSRTGLLALDISSNSGLAAHGQTILSSLDASKSLKELNLQHSNIPQELEENVYKLLVNRCYPDMTIHHDLLVG